MDRLIMGRAVVGGAAAGHVLASDEPLSFWGGYDPESGEVIDRRHPLSGQVARGRILAIPSTRGSSTTTAILLEAIRAGNAPAAIVTEGTDAFLALASVVADELFGLPLPLVALGPEDYQTLRTGMAAEVNAEGQIRLSTVEP